MADAPPYPAALFANQLRTTFAADGTNTPVLGPAWRIVNQQMITGRRVLVVPGYKGTASKTVGPSKNTASIHRNLIGKEELITVYCHSRALTAASSVEDEAVSYNETKRLADAVDRVLHLYFHGRYKFVIDDQWVVDANERRAGATLMKVISLGYPVLDIPFSLEPPIEEVTADFAQVNPEFGLGPTPDPVHWVPEAPPP